MKQVKSKVKKFRSNFKQTHGRMPNQDDIKSRPHILKLYSTLRSLVTPRPEALSTTSSLKLAKKLLLRQQNCQKILKMLKITLLSRGLDEKIWKMRDPTQSGHTLGKSAFRAKPK